MASAETNMSQSVSPAVSSETETPSGASSEKKCIHDNRDERGRLSIFESPDKSEAYMVIDPADAEEQFCADDVLSALDKTGITTGIDETAISEATSHLLGGGTPTECIRIASGRQPVAGRDGGYVCFFSDKNPHVEAGKVILKTTEPVPGTAGIDIYGHPISPPPVAPATVIAGEHVFEDAPNEFTAEIAGLACLENNVINVHRMLEIRISDDEMDALLTCTGSAALTREHIIEALYAKQVTYGIDEQAIDFVVSSFQTEKKPLKNFIIARGSPSKPGRDGQITYGFDVTEGPSYQENANGSINIRETNIIRNVAAGQELAELIPHKEPTYGKNLHGQIIAPPKVKKVSLRAGKNVRISEDGKHFFAETSGYPVIEKDSHGTRISVSDVFSVPGDLNLAIGNIDFDGVVEIGGDVEDGFCVKATKSIIIHGIVGACEIRAGADIQIQGGCNGKDQAILHSGNTIEAKYLNEATVVSDGDITIKNEIVNSSVTCRGRVTVPSGGSIRGGKIVAKQGVEAYDVGSDMGVKTVLIPGQDYRLNEALKQLDDRIVAINSEDAEISTRIAPLLKNRELLSKLPQEQREKLQETIAHVKNLRAEKERLNVEKNTRIIESLRDACPEVVVTHHIYQGVILKIGDSRREVSSQLEGPLRLYEENDRVTVEPYAAATAPKRRSELTLQALKKYADLPDDQPGAPVTPSCAAGTAPVPPAS